MPFNIKPVIIEHLPTLSTFGCNGRVLNVSRLHCNLIPLFQEFLIRLTYSGAYERCSGGLYTFFSAAFAKPIEIQSSDVAI